MEEAFPIFVLFGVGFAALILILIGIFAAGRSRHSPDQDGSLSAPPPLLPAEAETLPRSSLESVRVYLEADGSAWVELDGRRYARLSDVGNERLVQRALATVGALQRFAGLAPVETSGTLTDELRAGHAPEDRALVIEFKGQRYRRLTDIHDGETGRSLLALIGELSVFAQGMVMPPKSGELSGQVAEEFLKQLGRPVSEPAPVRLPSLVNSGRRPVSAPEPMPVGIAGQIDRILQEQLLTNPTLQGRSIQVVTAKDGSLAIELDRQMVPWPEGVSDPLVREAVEKAIRDWEKL